MRIAKEGVFVSSCRRVFRFVACCAAAAAAATAAAAAAAALLLLAAVVLRDADYQLFVFLFGDLFVAKHSQNDA